MSASNSSDPTAPPTPPAQPTAVDENEGTIVLDEVSVAMPMPQAPPPLGNLRPPPPPPRPRAPTPPPQPTAAPAGGAAPDVEESTIAVSLEEMVAEVVAAGPPPVIERAGQLAAQLLGAERTATLSGLYEREVETYEGRPDSEVGRPVAELHHEIGELVEAAGDAGAAVKFYARALSADPTLHPNVWAIRRIFESRALWPNLLRLLDAELAAAQRPEERAELLLEKGELCEDRLADPATAQRCFEEAVALAPGNLRGWQALYRQAVRASDPPAIIAALEGLVAATTDPGRKVAALLERARLEEAGPSGTPDPAAALQTLTRALQFGAERARVLDEMELVAERTGDREPLLAVWEARIDEAAPPLKIHYRLRQAHATAEQPERALAYLDEAQKLDPENLVVLWERLELERRRGDVGRLVS